MSQLQSLLGDTFISKTSEVSFEEVVSNPVVVLYFSAHWCPPCRNFTPVLASFYNEVNDPDKRLEIVFVSSDKEQDSFNEYTGTMPWVSIPYGDSRNQSLKTQFKVSGIPLLIVLNKNGTLAHGAARADVTNDGPAAFDKWLSLVN
jgi:nucleoredoxin